MARQISDETKNRAIRCPCNFQCFSDSDQYTCPIDRQLKVTDKDLN